MKLKLTARVNRSDAQTIQHALEELSANGSLRKADNEFVVEADMEGASAKELNRTLRFSWQSESCVRLMTCSRA
jgi:hypothetical protein